MGGGVPGRGRWRFGLVIAGAALVLAGCGLSPSRGTSPTEEAFLAYVHGQVPTINNLRSDSQLLGMGKAACTLFRSGMSFQTLADQMAIGDGGLPTTDLGAVITGAAEDLCPSFRSQVS